MERSRSVDGQTRWVLGPVEMTVATSIPVALVGLLIWLATAGYQQLRDTSDKLTVLATAQAVTNSQLQTLSVQLADVPALTRQLAELKVQVQRNTDDLRDLKTTARGGAR